MQGKLRRHNKRNQHMRDRYGGTRNLPGTESYKKYQRHFYLDVDVTANLNSLNDVMLFLTG